MSDIGLFEDIASLEPCEISEHSYG